MEVNANWLFQCLRCSLNLFDRASPPVIKVLRGSGNGCNFSTIASPLLQHDSKEPAARVADHLGFSAAQCRALQPPHTTFIRPRSCWDQCPRCSVNALNPAGCMTTCGAAASIASTGAPGSCSGRAASRLFLAAIWYLFSLVLSLILCLWTKL